MDRKVTVPDILKRKGSGDPIVALTAYDYPFGRIADEAGVDLILVGDSLGMVVQGMDSTLPVTMDEMVYHCRMVARRAAGPCWSVTCRSCRIRCPSPTRSPTPVASSRKAPSRR